MAAAFVSFFVSERAWAQYPQLTSEAGQAYQKMRKELYAHSDSAWPMSSWGQMVSAGTNLMTFKLRPWLWMPAGFCILLTVLAVNLVGDGLRDAFDPKMKR